MIALPLTNLLKKNTDFKFGTAEEHAFSTLKSLLSSEPVIQLYNPEAITELHTDASQDGLAAVLLQKQTLEDNLHPIYYMSQTTSPAEKRYHSYELEVLAIVVAVKKFRHYLLGIPFKIITDCAAFNRTVKKKDMPNRVARWILYLEEFEYTMEHTAGNRLKHVDALSRCPVLMFRDSFTKLMSENQNKDETIVAIKKALEHGEYDNYIIEGGVLKKMINSEM